MARSRPYLIAFCLALLALPASAAELLMYRRAGCPWCLAWDKEVGPVYSKAEIARRAPLRMVDLDAGANAKVELARPIAIRPPLFSPSMGARLGVSKAIPATASSGASSTSSNRTWIRDSRPQASTLTCPPRRFGGRPLLRLRSSKADRQLSASSSRWRALWPMSDERSLRA